MRHQHFQSDKCYTFIYRNMTEPKFDVIEMAVILYLDENLLCFLKTTYTVPISHQIIQCDIYLCTRKLSKRW